MKIIDDGPKWQQVSAFIQGGDKVNPDDSEYKFHSKAIVEVLNELQVQFEEAKKEADLEEAARVKTYEETVEALTKEIELCEGNIQALEEEIATLTEEIATARASLVEAEATMKDDKLYLTDLTQTCEKRGKEWDQRTSTRYAELENLKKALALLTDVVMVKDEVNVRAFLQRHGGPRRNGTAKAANGSAPTAPSFVQERLVTVHRVSNLRGQGHQSAALETQDREARKSRALELLLKSGSTTLAALAAKASADPFMKVKELIQKLIERLVKEATEEATKKGFCDTELAKNEKDRTYRMEEVMKLNTELQSLEAKRDFLELEISELKEALDVLYKELKEATEVREKEKAANLATIKTAKEGAVAVKEAILILQTFYKEAAKVDSGFGNEGKYSLAQQKTKASPMEEDTEGAGFEGKYNGKQDAMKAIIGILDVIKSDFTRTMQKTMEAEKTAQADFVIYERNTKADIASKETKVQLDEEDLATTKATIEQKTSEMQDNMDLVDSACEALESLKPMCIDSGMSYEERVAKREEEIEQLKKALCILDENGVEPTC
jgi:predicted  nucleic acid-binding Zn-ribbon protein